jgi:hypothetical protein
MKNSLLQHFEEIPYFTIEGFRQASGADSPEQTRILLYRWAKAGHVIPLKKGVYMTKRFYERHRGDPLFSATVSAILVPQSYLSLEYVLQQNNILTEITYPVTCITIKNTRKIENSIGFFWYRNIKRELYKGFSLGTYFGMRFAIASAAKALFDYLYLRPLPPAFRKPNIDLASELRLNLDDLTEEVHLEFSNHVDESDSRKMRDILKNLEENIWRH